MNQLSESIKVNLRMKPKIKLLKRNTLEAVSKEIVKKVLPVFPQILITLTNALFPKIKIITLIIINNIILQAILSYSITHQLVKLMFN